MGALADDPGFALAVLFILCVGRIPADRGRIQEQVGSGQGHQARAFGIPLVPADQHAELADRCLDRLEAEVARGEVELLVEGRIVRDVHLAIDAGDRARAVKDDGGVVIEPRSTTLEQRADHDQAQFLGQRADAFGRRARNGLGTVELIDAFVLAEIRAVVQLLQQHQLRTGARGLAQADLDGVQIGRGAAVVGFLQQGNLEGLRAHGNDGKAKAEW